MTQPPYGSSDYNPPSPPSYAPPAPTPSYAPYAPTPTYPPAQAYPPGYPPATTPAYTPQWDNSGAPVVKARSPLVGIIGLALVLIATVLVGVGSYQMYMGLIPLVPTDSWTTGTIPDLTMIDQNALSGVMAGPIGILGLSVVVGLVGFVMAIVGIATRRGRGVGIAGVIVGVIAPVIALIVGAAMALSAAGVV